MADSGKETLTETWEEIDLLMDRAVGEFRPPVDTGSFSLEDIISEVHQTARQEKQEQKEEEEAEPGQEGLLPENEAKEPETIQESETIKEEQETPGEAPAPLAKEADEEQIARRLKAIFDEEPELLDEEFSEDVQEIKGPITAVREPKIAPKILTSSQPEEEEEQDFEIEAEPREDDLEVLAQQLADEKKRVHKRFVPALVLTILLVGAALLQIFLVPAASFLGAVDTTFGNMILQLCLCAAVAGFLYREMGEGLKRLFSLAPTQLSISVLGVIAALGHGLLQIPQVGSGEGFVFFGPAAALGLLAAVWSRDLRLGLHLDHVHRLADCPVKQQLEIIKDPRVARIIKAELGEELTAARDLVLIRRERTESTFDTQRILERKNNAESWSEKMTPFMVVAIIVATAVVMLLTRQGGELLTVFTIFTITMVPLCAHFAPVSPMLWARRRFPTSVILNNTEAEAFSHCDGLLFQDSDLFDKDCLILKGIRVLGENNKIDELMVDVASVLCHLDIGLGSLFLPIIKNDLSLLKEVTKTGCYRGEGVRATVGGEELVIGTFEYMQKCGHLSPYAKKKEQAENSKIKNIYVAKGNELSCIFTVGYVVRGNTKLELDSLYKNSINIILDSRDMNLTKKNLIRMFGVEEDGIFTVDTRGQDQKKKPENKRKKGVYTLEDNLFSFADTIWACRHMKGMEWRNIMIHLVLSVISFVLFFALMAVGGIDQVTVENTLLYLLICCIPFVLNSVI